MKRRRRNRRNAMPKLLRSPVGIGLAALGLFFAWEYMQARKREPLQALTAKEAANLYL